MIYLYTCGKEVIRAWVYDDNFHTTVSVADTKTIKSYERTIRKDEHGKFFTWNKNKIYLRDWIRIPMKELKARVEKGEYCTSDDLCRAILTDGAENVRFIVPLADGDNFKDTLCKVNIDYPHKITANYKISLVPVEQSEDTVTHREFYTSDMITLIRKGLIKIVA